MPVQVADHEQGRDEHLHVVRSDPPSVRRSPTFARQGAEKVHVVVTEAPGFARCGANVDGDEYLARLVPHAERCQASGCRAAWPAVLRVVS